MPTASGVIVERVPEMMFDVRWPDGRARSFSSPSLVVEDHLTPGTSYPIADFVDRSRTSMRIADERVRAKYGFGCAQAAATLAEIESLAAGFDAADQVTVLSFRR